MSLTDLLFAQLADPFRIGLLIALFITMLRTQNATGTVVPLAAGAVFVAVIIPATQAQAAQAVPFLHKVAVGIVADVILLAIILAAWTLFQRLRRG
jgi:hypothetical protein